MPGPLQVFVQFFVLGLTSFGGPVAHLGYFHERFVQRERWITAEAYADLVGLCQLLPGPSSSQVGMGSGRIQTIRALADDSAIYVTTGEYLTPSGRALRIKGIQPDVAAALTTDEENILKADDLGTAKDRVYKAAELSLLERVNQ